MSIRSMDIGKKGFCLKKGHPVEHVLTLDCWVELRRWLHDNPENYDAYVKACKLK